MMNCGQAQEWMNDRLDQALDVRLLRAHDEHLAECGACRREWKLMESSWQALELLPVAELSANFQAGVWEKIRRQPAVVVPFDSGRRVSGRSSLSWGKLALPLLASAASLVLGVGLLRPVPLPAAEATRPTVARVASASSASAGDSVEGDVELGRMSHDYLAFSESALNDAMGGN